MLEIWKFAALDSAPLFLKPMLAALLLYYNNYVKKIHFLIGLFIETFFMMWGKYYIKFLLSTFPISTLTLLCLLDGYPLRGKSSVCLICMKYRIIILIIIIISLGQILLSYIANTSRTHACASTHRRRRRHTG